MKQRFSGCLTALFAAILLTSMPTWAEAQTQVDHTRFSTAVTATQNTVTLVANSGTVAGDYFYADGELMQAETRGTGNTWRVRRGLGQGFVPARAHSTTAVVWTGGGGEFKDFDVTGTCSQAIERYLPLINTKGNHVFDCSGSGTWMARSGDWTGVESARTVCGGLMRCRDEFNQGYLIMQDDGTVKSLTDAEENFVYGSPVGPIEYREEQTKTVSSWVAIDGQLDISADDTTASEGVEIVFDASSDAGLNQVIEAGTNGACFAAMVTIANVATVTQLQFGWRQNEAFQDAAAYTGYARWNTIGLTTTNGAITSSQEVSGATTTDLASVTWANGERRALKVCLSSAGVPSAAYTDASPDNEAPVYRWITMTNTGVAQTAGTGMIPFMTFLAAGTTDAGVTIQWVQIEYAP